jgi:hypothetical protein
MDEWFPPVSAFAIMAEKWYDIQGATHGFFLQSASNLRKQARLIAKKLTT